MKKTNVVIASVLKPVDEPRMYEKIACSLADKLNFHVHIIGYVSGRKDPLQYPNISLYPVFHFKRLSAERFTASWKYYKILRKVKPAIIVVTSIDLLIVTVLYKIIFGAEILYDVQENYMYNSLYTEKFRLPLNLILGYGFRLSEWLMAPFISHFILAELTYEKELPFIGKRFTVVQNKYQPIQKQDHELLTNNISRPIYHLLYTGTIAESYGIFEVINLVKGLNKLDKRFHLTIAGYCADHTVLAKISNRLNNIPFIRLIGGHQPVPHSILIDLVRQADIGLVAYRYNKSTVNRIPTKLNEYMYHRLPILLPLNPLWEEYCKPYNSYLAIDYYNKDYCMIYYKLLFYKFYGFAISYDNLTWELEEQKLIHIFSKI